MFNVSFRDLTVISGTLFFLYLFTDVPVLSSNSLFPFHDAYLSFLLHLSSSSLHARSHAILSNVPSFALLSFSSNFIALAAASIAIFLIPVSFLIVCHGVVLFSFSVHLTYFIFICSISFHSFHPPVFRSVQYHGDTVWNSNCLNQVQRASSKNLPFIKEFFTDTELLKAENQYNKILNINWTNIFEKRILNCSYELWAALYAYYSAGDKYIFRDLALYTLKILSLPSSNAVVERGFSIMNLID